MNPPPASRLPVLSMVAASLALCWGAAAHAGQAASAAGAAQQAGEPETLPGITVHGARQTLRGELPAAYAGGQVARGASLGMLGNADFMDTPFSVTSYTAQVMQDQQARSLNDVVKNDASVRTLWADSSYNSQFAVRGFAVSGQDIAVNGVYGIVPPQLTNSLGMFERVEVLRGPSAMINGMAPFGALGGTLNLVTKRATDAPIAQVTASHASRGQFGMAVDLGRRLGEEHQLGIRFNGSWLSGDTAVEGQSQRVGSAALGLDYRGDRVRLSADVGYQDFRVDDPSRPIYTQTGDFDIPNAPSGRRSFGQPWYYAKSEDVFGMLHGEIDLMPNLTAYFTAGGRRNRFLGLYNFLYLQNGQGDYQARQYYQPNYSDTWTALGGLTGRVVTGPVRHTLNLSVSTLDIESGNLVQTPQPSPYSGNLANPPSLPGASLAGFVDEAPRTAHSVLSSMALADTLSMFDDRLALTLGIRHQDVTTSNYNAVSGARASRYDEGAYTPAFAVVVKPLDSLSLYANYVQSLSQGPTAPTQAANSGEMFAPVKSEQYEIGAKVDLDGFGGSISYFEIRQPSGIMDPVTRVYGLDGEQRNRGLEINAFGRVAQGVRLLGGVAFMDGRLVKTQGGAADGNKAVGVPDVQLNLGAEWDVPHVPGLTVSTRYIHTASQYYNAANTQSIPSWDRIDVGARYRTRVAGHDVTLRAGVENLFDRDYWAAASASYGLARGNPRTYLLSATMSY
ncbi:TonB-dependent receptor [Castellaniella defragrans]|uniref:Iron complex outermembrane receptor protein n=1 Tax=Castellaniella defragrans TaxID=75697 RepID=A0A7W9TQY9_CASDE|nr:TonB-dependent siderophore receptor [Castellaniella defragrans]KAB0623568.1 TonB-dependent siderophore receptor [Castellaniella defragrans]MBB6083942.1 iron complex outermembrane receptor protein [Castellaniella defragrans]